MEELKKLVVRHDEQLKKLEANPDRMYLLDRNEELEKENKILKKENSELLEKLKNGRGRYREAGDRGREAVQEVS